MVEAAGAMEVAGTEAGEAAEVTVAVPKKQAQTWAPSRIHGDFKLRELSSQSNVALSGRVSSCMLMKYDIDSHS